MRGAIKLHPFGTSAEQTHVEVVQFNSPSSTYPAILLLVQYFILLIYGASFDTSAKRNEACVLKGCIKNCSIVELYNKVLLINTTYSEGCMITSKAKINAS